MMSNKTVRGLIPTINQIRRLISTSHGITEKKISVDGIDINCVQAGNGPKNILLMPGALGSAWTDFKPQILLLPKTLPDYTIIAWDPPGYGKSIPPKRDFSLNFFNKDANYAKNLMKALGKDKFSILGWSDGGITAMILCGTHPELVEKLVIWGAGAYINAEEIKVLESIRDVEKWSTRMRKAMEKTYGVEEFKNLWSSWIDAVINIYKKRNGDFCKQEVERINAPTLIIHGKKDPLIAAEHIPYLLKRIKGVGYHEFPDGKHNIHLKYSYEFNKVVTDFLQK